MPASPNLIAELAAANHILFDQGVVDAFGHISVRHDRFLLARNMAPVTYLTAAEGLACTHRVEGQVRRPSEFWKAEAAKRRAA